MARTEGILHRKLPPDAVIHVRDKDEPIRAEDTEQFSPTFVAKSLLALHESLGIIARQTENHANPVDEYQTCPLTGAASESTLTLQPTYDFMPEKILSVLVCGPANANVTLILGDRQWPVTIPAAGILPIGPIAIILGRSDARQLVSSTPGNYFLELMGYADRRFET